MRIKAFSKITKKGWIIGGVSFALTCVIATGATAAYLTHTTKPAFNSFQPGYVNIRLVEMQDGKDQNNDNEDITTLDFDDITTEGVEKHVAVKNNKIKDYPTVKTYVRVRLVPSIRDASGNLVPIDVKGKVTYYFNNPSDWKYTVQNGEKYYYYTKAIDPEEVTSELINKVSSSIIMDEDQHLEVQVFADGIAAEQPGSLSAWFTDKTDDQNDFNSTYFKDLQSIETSIVE